jgi:hypothetical protein
MLAVALTALAAAPALAAMAFLTVNAVSFDQRTFEYGGHVPYQYTSLPPVKTLETLTHNNSNCSSGQCASNPEYVVKCRITAGNTDYGLHTLRAKILKNGVVVNDTDFSGNLCDHADNGWEYDPSWLVDSPYHGITSDARKFRVTIEDTGENAKDSNDVDL